MNIAQRLARLQPVFFLLAGGCSSATAAVDSGVDSGLDAVQTDSSDSSARDASTDAAPEDATLDANAAGTCDRVYADGESCSFASPCTQTVGNGCTGTCRCSTSGDVSCVYGDTPACREYVCPAEPPGNGSIAPAASPSIDALDQGCNYGTRDCPIYCYIIGAATPTRRAWVCTTPAGPTCPASDCPPTLPEACGWPGSTWCSYPSQDSCRVDCLCQGGRPQCLPRNCDCPPELPGLNSACPPEPYRASCNYVRNEEPILCTCGISDSPTWNCFATNHACPETPPEGRCQAGLDPTMCSYNQAPYCGRCGCDASGHWACSDSTCDQCPETPPVDRSPCTVDQIGQICDFAGAPCSCIGPNPTWACS